MKSLTEQLEEAVAAETQNAEGLYTPGQVAYVVNKQDPMMAAVLRIIEETQKLKGEVFVARLLFIGCPDHPEYRPLQVGGELVANPYPDCEVCAALYSIAETYKKEYLTDASVHDDGASTSSV